VSLLYVLDEELSFVFSSKLNYCNFCFSPKGIFMKTILHIDSSARKKNSITRELSSKFINTWLKMRPDDTVITRDVGQSPPPFVSEDWITAAFTAEDERTDEQNQFLRPSDLLINELEKADIIVIGAPMYNYGMPASLKAWVDQIVRLNKTFSFDLARGDFPLEPILKDKTLICLTSKGEFGFTAGVRQQMNHLDGHLATLSHYLGTKEQHIVSVEYQGFSDERRADSHKKADYNTVALAEALARVA
jgi:FMN-dependent NADH-azoreductase